MAIEALSSNPGRVPVWLLFLLSMTAGCPPKTTEFATPEQRQSALTAVRCDTDEFQRMARSFAVSARDTTPPAENLPAVSAESLEHATVHDCQRLIVDGRLGPQVGLLVSERAVESGDFDSGVVVADIVNYDRQPYDNLGIPAGPSVSCLWLKRSDSDAEEWIASIRVPRTGACTTARFDDAPTDTLRVEVAEIQRGGGTLPSTGRWMWEPAERNGANDGVAGQQFIGVRCENDWCEIGSRTFTPTGPYASAADLPGWRDEQPLSYWVESSLRLSGLVGRISPGRHVEEIEDGLPSDSDVGHHAATIDISGNDPAAREGYWEKMALAPGSNTHRVYHQKQGFFLFPKTRMARAETERWTRVDYNPHVRHSPVGAVRWAWNERDEGLWYACDEGCCKADEMQRN